MKEYQAKQYFEWGSLKLEPLQYLEVKQAEVKDCLIVIRESDQKSIIVSKKAFQNQLNLGRIVQK